MHLQRIHRLDEALAVFTSAIRPLDRTEHVPLHSALGRVLAASVAVSDALPSFAKSTMDGYAVRSQDVSGATETIPALLQMVADVHIGEMPDWTLEPGQAAPIATGAPLPAGADAVVMIEYTEEFDDTTVAVHRPLAPYENVLRVGEDVQVGDALFRLGHQLRPGDLGALAAVGHASVPVLCQPQVAVFSTGNELVPPDVNPLPGQVRDINGFTLAGQVIRCGGIASIMGILPDNEIAIRSALEHALMQFDLVVLSGGSSLGTYDLTERVLNSLGKPGVLVHGLAVKPGKPTILSSIEGKGVIGFPGHPLSAMMTAEMLLPPVLAHLSRRNSPARRQVQATLTRSLRSQVGRTEYVQVRLTVGEEGGLLAEPLLSKSAMISSVARATGYIIIAEGGEGLRQGTEVEVFLWGEMA